MLVPTRLNALLQCSRVTVPPLPVWIAASGGTVTLFTKCPLLCPLRLLALSVIFAPPQSPHLLAARQQFIQRSLGLDPAVLENDDLVSALESRMSVRNHQAGRLPALEDTLP